MTSAALELSPKPRPSLDAGGDGDDVLQRAAQLDAEQVRAGIDAEGGAVKELLHLPGGGRVPAGRHDGRGNVARDLDGEGRPGQRRAFGLGGGLGQDAAHGQAGVVFDALGDADDRARVIGPGGG